MYSVEDLLISHGYKLPQNNSTSGPASHGPSPLPPSYEQRPPRSDSRCEVGPRRPVQAAPNGYEPDPVPYTGAPVRHAPAKGYPGDTENRERRQRPPEEQHHNPGGPHPPGPSLTTDSGFNEGPRDVYSQSAGERDVTYWRRRGQDFSALLDYAEFRDPRGGGGGGGVRAPRQAEGMRRTPEMAANPEEHYRERQQRAESARVRERELALQQWKIAAERKYQSLGSEEWRPALAMGRQQSDSECDRWAQEQRRPRTAEGAVPPRSKAKSQSLPRMALPCDGLQYFSMSSSSQDPYGSYRINGHPSRDPQGRHHSEEGSREQWPENGRSSVQSAPLSKPRFSRPLRPPSYEMHQQIRGSSEMLSGELAPHSRDRTPLPFTRQEYYAQEPGGSGVEPPGYNPPPSYRRQPIRVASRTYADAMGNYQYRGDPYLQGPAMAEVQQWFIRQTGMAWPEHHRDGRRSMPCRRQAYPGYGKEHQGNVQYIPFDDPRVRHISTACIDGNSLTDADKIRNIRNEIPTTQLSEQSPDNSAFLPPEITFNSTDPIKSNPSVSVHEDNWPVELKGGTDSNSNTVPDQNCNVFSLDQCNSNPLQVTPARPITNLDQAYSEMITQVKKFEPATVTENKKNSKKKLKETMFCLVSVPINLSASREAADQNNNKKAPSPVMSSEDNTVVQSHSLSLPKTSSNGLELHSGSSSSIRNSKRAPLRKEIVDAWSLQASTDKELCYAGSWPGDQYKNQETQTGSPEVSRSTPSANIHIQVTHDPPSSDTTTDSGVGTDCSTNFGYPIKGHKNLSPSSNSAFSRTRAGSSSSQSERSPGQHQPALTSPSPDRQSASRRSAQPKPQADGQEAFGQFLLKPVNRRPWDAIEELESFNKELQDQISKRPNVDQCIDDLDEAYQNILELSNTSSDVANAALGSTASDNEWDRLTQSQLEACADSKPSEEHVSKVILNARPELDNRMIKVADPNHGEMRNAFSRPKVGSTNLNRHQTEDDVGFLSLEILEKMRGASGRPTQDIPVPKECLLKDVGLTVYTAIPDTIASGSQSQSSESPMLTSPSDNSELFEASPITPTEDRGEPDEHGSNFINIDLQSLGKPTSLSNRNEPPCEVVSERGLRQDSPRSSCLERSPRGLAVRTLNIRLRADYGDDDEIYSDHLSWRNEQTLADKHLETLLSQEKANSLPAEDLSNLYQVQCAKGIPENESIEQRAARILGIAVPAESLIVEQSDRIQALEEPLCSTESEQGSEKNTDEGSGEEMQHVSRVLQEVTWTSMDNHEPEGNKENVRISDVSVGKHTAPVTLGIPEFPPSSLPLSLIATEDVELTLSVGGGERKGEASVKMGETLQDETALSTSLTPSTCSQVVLEQMFHMEEVDSDSRLSLKSTNSEETEEVEEEMEDNNPKEERESIEEEVENEISVGTEDDEKIVGLEVDIEHQQYLGNQEVEVERNDIDDEDEEHRTEKEAGEKTAPKEELNEESTDDERVVGLEVDIEHQHYLETQELEVESNDIDEENEEDWFEKEVREKTAPEEELNEESEDDEKVVGLEVDIEHQQYLENQEQEVGSNDTAGEDEEEWLEKEVGEKRVPEEELSEESEELLPAPPQRPVPQPRTVAKREITLPLGLSMASASDAMEDDDMLSDTYDPSRVERV